MLLRSFASTIVFVCISVGLSLLSYIPHLHALFSGRWAIVCGIIVLVLTTYGVARYAPKILHPFVWAIIFGMALQYPLREVIASEDLFMNILKFLAAFILFAAGLAVPVKNFKKYFAPIAALSLVGTLVSVVLFSYALGSLTDFFVLSIPPLSLIVLAAILASVDPTALRMSVEHLRFARPFIRDIAAGEGALNDVVGVVLSRFFIVASISAGGAYSIATISAGFGHLSTRALLEPLALELIWGWLVGLLGYFILKHWGASVRTLHWSDPALFTIVPLFCFALGSFIGGAGYLAAFIAGLLFEMKTDLAEVRVFFDTVVGNSIKPAVFVLLGAIVPLSTMLDLLPLGIAAAFVFILIIRPVVVYISLAPWMHAQKSIITWREVLFLSFVRETGAVPAVLLLIAVTLGLASSELVLVVGVWVILMTLIVEPPLTPIVAVRLGVAKEQ